MQTSSVTIPTRRPPVRRVPRKRASSKPQQLAPIPTPSPLPPPPIYDTDGKPMCLCGLSATHMLCSDAIGSITDPSLLAGVRTVASLMQRFLAADGGIAYVQPLEDTRLALLVAPFLRQHFRCAVRNVWYYVDDFRWLQADASPVLRVMSDQVLPALGALRAHVAKRPAGLLAEHVLRNAERQLRKHDTRRRVACEAGLLPGICDSAFGDRLDANGDLLGFENGVFDLNAGTFRKGRPEDFIGMSTGHHFPSVADATTLATKPTVLALLHRLESALPKPAERRYVLHLLVDCCLARRCDMLHCLLGTGANFKSTLARLIAAMLGQYYLQIEPEMLTRLRPGSAAAAPDILALRNKRCVVLAEACSCEAIKTAFLKRLTGGETLLGRDLFSSRMVSVQPVCTLLLLTNNPVSLPATRHERDAVHRRVRCIHFSVHFVERHEWQGGLQASEQDEAEHGEAEHDAAAPDADKAAPDAHAAEADADEAAPDADASPVAMAVDEPTKLSAAAVPTTAAAVPTTAAAVPRFVLDAEIARGAGDFLAYLLLCVLPAYRAEQQRNGTDHGLPHVATIAADSARLLQETDDAGDWLATQVAHGTLRRRPPAPPSLPTAASPTVRDVWDAYVEHAKHTTPDPRIRIRRNAFVIEACRALGEAPVRTAGNKQRFVGWLWQHDNASDGTDTPLHDDSALCAQLVRSDASPLIRNARV